MVFLGAAMFLSALLSNPVHAQNEPGFDVAQKDFNDKDAKEDGNRGVTAPDFYKLVDNSVGDHFGSMILVFGGCYSGDFAAQAGNSKISKKPVAVLTATAPTSEPSKGRYECTPSLDGENPFLTGVVSRGRCNTSLQFIRRSLKSQRLSRPGIETQSDHVEF